MAKTNINKRSEVRFRKNEFQYVTVGFFGESLTTLVRVGPSRRSLFESERFRDAPEPVDALDCVLYVSRTSRRTGAISSLVLLGSAGTGFRAILKERGSVIAAYVRRSVICCYMGVRYA
jgi:hypothetical protein